MSELAPPVITQLATEVSPSTQCQEVTITFPVRSDEVLLGMKKRGHGVNYLNGFGGKLQPRETPLDATVRELKEESGLEADPSAIEPTGILTVMGSGKPMVIYLSRCLSWEGVPEETEEMRPAWFTVGHKLANGTFVNHLPLEEMWPNDRLWIIAAVLGCKACYNLTVTNNLTILQTTLPHADDPWQPHGPQPPEAIHQNLSMQQLSCEKAKNTR